jgi:hypothetical protein
MMWRLWVMVDLLIVEVGRIVLKVRIIREICWGRSSSV